MGALLLSPLSAARAAQEDASARAIELSSIPAPVFSNGKLQNYFFVTVRVVVANGENVVKLRERSHFVRDAFVRRLHAASVGAPGRSDEINEKALLGAIEAAAKQVLGERAVARVEIVSAEPLRKQ
jgi:hypothetical protein